MVLATQASSGLQNRGAPPPPTYFSMPGSVMLFKEVGRLARFLDMAGVGGGGSDGSLSSAAARRKPRSQGGCSLLGVQNPFPFIWHPSQPHLLAPATTCCGDGETLAEGTLPHRHLHREVGQAFLHGWQLLGRPLELAREAVATCGDSPATSESRSTQAAPTPPPTGRDCLSARSRWRVPGPLPVPT